MENIQKQLAQVMAVEQVTEEKEKNITTVDFKMVTFSLSGKDYAIDIMSVKEIAKAGRFTYVPNTAPFVLGVYNLRGEIIPIIDLRLFFNIEIEERADNQIENMIIVSVDDNVFGIVVDGIDKVVGIQKSTIQPPHPLFGDINIKYIYGVVESENRLYVLLDIGRIFTNKSKEESVTEETPKLTVSKLPQTNSTSQMQQVLKPQEIPTVRDNSPAIEQSSSVSKDIHTVSSVVNAEVQEDSPLDFSQERQSFNLNTKSNSNSVDYDFIVDELRSLKKFFVTDINSAWVKSRFVAWQDEKGLENSQLNSEKMADEFLKEFDLPDIRSAMKTIYNMNEIDDQYRQKQISSLIERNQIMLARSEKLRNEDTLLGVELMNYIPVLLFVIQLLVVMVLSLTWLMQTVMQSVQF